MREIVVFEESEGRFQGYFSKPFMLFDLIDGVSFFGVEGENVG